MNKRIEEFIKEATVWEGMENGYIFDKEKFAELLIQECVRCAEGEWIRNGDTEHNRAVSGVIESIKEHFGVE
jgi:hypothetical protein